MAEFVSADKGVGEEKAPAEVEEAELSELGLALKRHYESKGEKSERKEKKEKR